MKRLLIFLMLLFATHLFADSKIPNIFMVKNDSDEPIKVSLHFNKCPPSYKPGYGEEVWTAPNTSHRTALGWTDCGLIRVKIERKGREDFVQRIAPEFGTLGGEYPINASFVFTSNPDTLKMTRANGRNL